MTQSPHRPEEVPAGTLPAPERPDGLALGVLVAALVLAGCRFLGLGAWSLWLDEAYTLADSRHGESLANPLGYVVFGGFYDLFEGRPGEFLLRFPAALLGFLCVPLSAWALRPFVGRRAAAVVALLIALSPWHVYWSQNARFYTLAQALGLAGGGLLFRGLQRDGPVVVGAGAVALGLAALVHPSAVLLAGALLFVPWILRRSGAWPAGVAPPAAWTVLGLACLAAVLGGTSWVYDVWRTWESRQGRGDPLHFVFSFGYLVTPLVAGGALLGALRLVRWKEPHARVLLAFVAASLTAALGASFFLRVSAQYVFVLLPWIAGLAAVPLMPRATPGREPSRLGPLYLVLLVTPLAVESLIYFGLRNGDRPHWREAYALVFEHRQPTDLVIGMEAPVAEYYLDPRADDLRDWRTVVQLDRFRARLPNDWARFGRRIWFVVNLEQLEDWSAEDRAEMRRILDEECTLRASWEISWTPRDLDVFVYLREAPVSSDSPR